MSDLSKLIILINDKHKYVYDTRIALRKKDENSAIRNTSVKLFLTGKFISFSLLYNKLVEKITISNCYRNTCREADGISCHS